MAVVEQWWEAELRERYWLELSARGDDLGVDFSAPTLNEVGEPFWSYDLLREVKDGDAVLHYDRDQATRIPPEQSAMVCAVRFRNSSTWRSSLPGSKLIATPVVYQPDAERGRCN